MARATRLDALAAFVAFLGTMPQIDKVGQALVRGPLALFGARAGIVAMSQEHREMRIVSHYGHTAKELSRYKQISLEIDVPIIQAFREGAVLVLGVDEVQDMFPVVGLDREMWQAMSDRLSASRLISAPIVYDGAPIGAYSFHTSSAMGGQDVDIAYLGIVSAALGMWMAHPRNGMRGAMGLQFIELDAPLVLTERQIDILRLVHEGLSNDRIAARLGYSLSTIKNEMQSVNKVLRTTERTEAVRRARELRLLDAVQEDHAG